MFSLLEMWKKEPLFKIIDINLAIDSISILECVEQFIAEINNIFLESNFYPIIKIPIKCDEIMEILTYFIVGGLWWFIVIVLMIVVMIY